MLRSLGPSRVTKGLDALVFAMKNDPEPSLRVLAASALASSPDETYRMFEVVFRAWNGDVVARIDAINTLGGVSDAKARAELSNLRCLRHGPWHCNPGLPSRSGLNPKPPFRC